MKCFSIHWSELHTLIVEAEDLSEAIATAKYEVRKNGELGPVRIDDNSYETSNPLGSSVDVEFDYNNCYQCDSNGISLDEKRS
jgi:hypothetical protein